MKKTTLSINPNYPNQTTANSGRGGYPTNSPMKFAALSDIMNQSNANKFQSPMPTSNHQPAYTFHTIPQGPLISPSNLSSTSNITTNNPNAFNNTTNSASAAAKLSKLQARKEKQIILNNTINNRKDPSSFLNEELNEFKQSYNNNQNIISKEMEENYKIEKKGFFNRLQEENQLLLQLLEVHFYIFFNFFI